MLLNNNEISIQQKRTQIQIQINEQDEEEKDKERERGRERNEKLQEKLQNQLEKNMSVGNMDLDDFSQDSNSSFGEATSTNSSDGSDDDISKQAIAEILLPRLLSYHGGLVRVTYANGAVMRDGLEIDTSEVLCSVPAETIIYALEQRLNSSNVWRLRVIYNGHYGWISERMRGGSEEYMLSKIRNPKKEIFNNIMQKTINEAKVLNIKDRIIWDVCSSIELAMKHWDKTVENIGQNSILSIGKEPIESYDEYIQLLITIDGKNKWEKEMDFQLSDFISQCATKEGNIPQNISVEKILQNLNYNNNINDNNINDNNNDDNNNYHTCNIGSNDSNFLTKGIDNTNGILPGGSLLHGIDSNRIIARISLLRVSNLILRYSLPYLNMSLLEEKQKKDCYGSDDSIDIELTELPNKVDVNKNNNNDDTNNNNNNNNNNASSSLPSLFSPPSTAKKLRALRRLLFNHTKTRWN